MSQENRTGPCPVPEVVVVKRGKRAELANGKLAMWGRALRGETKYYTFAVHAADQKAVTIALHPKALVKLLEGWETIETVDRTGRSLFVRAKDLRVGDIVCESIGSMGNLSRDTIANVVALEGGVRATYQDESQQIFGADTYVRIM